MKLNLLSESSTEPVTVAEFRIYLRMGSTDSTSEDGLLTSFLSVARQKAENITRRSLVSQTWRLTLDEFPHWDTELPRAAPLSTTSTAVIITFVTDTTAGTSTTLSSTGYAVDSASTPARIYPSYQNDWPSNVRDDDNAVTIQYITGYSTVPEPIKNWIKMVAADLYENRQGLVEAQTYRIPRVYVDGMLDDFVVPR